MSSILVSTTSDTTDGFMVLGSWAGLAVAPASCPLGSEVPSAKLAGGHPGALPARRLCSLLLLRLLPPSLFPPHSGFQAQEAQPPRTAFTERRWGCQKPGEDVGSMPRALPGAGVLGTRRAPVSGLYVWPSAGTASRPSPVSRCLRSLSHRPHHSPWWVDTLLGPAACQRLSQHRPWSIRLPLGPPCTCSGPPVLEWGGAGQCCNPSAHSPRPQQGLQPLSFAPSSHPRGIPLLPGAHVQA